MARFVAAVTFLLAAVPAQQRSPCFLTVVDLDGRPVQGAAVTCSFMPSLVAIGEADVAHTVTDERGRARCELVPGALYCAWAVGPVDEGGSRCVSEVLPLVAVGRVAELSLVERVGPRRIAVTGLDAWRDAGVAGLRWFPDRTQDAHVDLPLPASDANGAGGCAAVELPPSPSAFGLLGLRAASGELVAVEVVGPAGEQPDETIVFPEPLALRAVVRNQRGEAIPEVRIEHWQPTGRGWGFLGQSLMPRCCVVGVTGADGVARCWLASPEPEVPAMLLAQKRGYRWQVQTVAAAGDVAFGLDVLAPLEVDVGDLADELGDGDRRATIALAARALVEARVGGGHVIQPFPVETTAERPHRWLVHRTSPEFVPTLCIVGPVPGAVVLGRVTDASAHQVDLDALTALDVEVVDAGGGPVAAALGVMSGHGNGVPLPWTQILATNVAGRARLWLPRGEHLVYATTGDCHAFRVLSDASAGVLRLALEPLTRMRIRVRDVDGPVRGAKAVVVRSGGGPAGPGLLAMLASYDYVRWTRSAADGLLTVRLFALPGTHAEICVEHGGRRSLPFPFVADGETEITLGR
ncbi:MAG: carboxypeptidase regulatory-like domain-containing protein [Planctomycetes bacterium]|nr:carboxypeptidase regulatory-like domain-containing protein [Planctomycetota bacterium]